MSKIAMVVPSWTGHLNPTCTLARALQRRGHDVTVISFQDSASALVKAGLPHRVIGSESFPEGEWIRLSRKLSRLTGFAAARFTLAWIGRISNVMLHELPVVLQDGGYSGVVVDQVCWGAECAAGEARVPLAVACNALPVHLQPDIPLHTQTWPWRLDPFSLFRNWVVQSALILAARPLAKPIQAHVNARGQRFQFRRYFNELPQSLVQITQLPECLDFPRRFAPDHFHHTGPWHDHSAAEDTNCDLSWLDGRPVIYASLGTLQNGLIPTYQTILDACAELPVQVAMALGREDGPRPARIPSNARVFGYAPQLAWLRHASLVITHAGLNTTLEALTQGLPLVAIPITHEQPGIAARIRHAGVGEFLALKRLTVERLRKLILQVHGEPRYRNQARKCAAGIQQTEGLVRAAELIERAFRSGQRIRRATRTN